MNIELYSQRLDRLFFWAWLDDGRNWMMDVNKSFDEEGGDTTHTE